MNFLPDLTLQCSAKRLIEGLKKAIEHLRAAGCRTIYINGSFVTDKLNPNDFDGYWDAEGVDIDYLRTNAPTLLNFLKNGRNEY